MWWWWFLLALISLVIAGFLHITIFKHRRGPIYWVRWVRILIQIQLERIWRERRVNNFDLNGEYEYLSIQATPTEQDLELPKPLITDRHEDEMSISGVGRDGSVIVARVTRFTQRRASVLLYIRDNDGNVYTLPNQPDTNHINVSSDGWRGAGLSITPVNAMRCWRLKFNGLMRKGVRETYITEGTEEDGRTSEDDIIQVRLDLLWHSLSEPVEIWHQTSPCLLAHAMAHQIMASLKTYRSEEGDGYEQWGSLHGNVTLGQTQPSIWHIRGPRTHRWGLAQNIGRGINTFTYFNNGDLLCLKSHTPTHQQRPRFRCGYLHKANGRVVTVTWTDLDPHHDPADPLHSFRGHNILVKFKAGGRLYETWQQLGDRMTFCTGDPWVTSHDLYPTTVTSNHSYGWGVTIVMRRYSDLCPVPERESLPIITVPRIDLDDDLPLLVTLDDPRCRCVDLTGGKAASVAFLMAYRELIDPEQEDYEVPLGIVLTVGAWRKQLQSHPELRQAVRSVTQSAALSQPARLKEACTRAVNICRGTPICAEVTEALISATSEIWDDLGGCCVAVRSSGCSEDGEEASAAGQNDTVLGVKGKDSLLKAVTSCWASLFSYHSVEYRRQHGQPVESGMGVIIQEMIPADIAGVIFTADPTTASPNTITITVNYGLGESVVSGQSEPDTIVVKRGWRGQLTIASRTKGSKTTQCLLKAEGGTEEVSVDETARKSEVLSVREALRLARVAVYIHEAFGTPRDIEFAMAKGTIYLLQSRPITTGDGWSDWELEHEHDTAILTDHEILTRANTGEVLPGSLSPLSLSLVITVLNVAFQKEIGRSDWPHTYFSAYKNAIASFNTLGFLNILEMKFRFIDSAELKVVDEALDLSIFGHIFTQKKYKDWGIERNGLMRSVKTAYILGLYLYDYLNTKSRLRKAQQKFGEYEVGSERAETAAELYAELTRRITHYMEVCYVHLQTSKISSTTQALAFVTLAQGNKGLSEENKSDMAIILSSCTGIESADVPTALKELAHVLGDNEERDEFVGMTAEEAAVWLQSHPGHIGHEFRTFIHRHGHRSIKELDFGAKSWRLEPHVLIHTLQVMVKSQGNQNKQALQENKDRLNNFQDIDKTLDSLTSPITPGTRRALKFMLPMCRTAVAQREISKSLTVKVTDALREGYRNLGQLLVQEGRLPCPDLVFYFTHSELGQLVTHPSPSFIAKARRRQKLQSQLDNLPFPEITFGVPHPVIEGDECDIVLKDGCRVLTGTPVCHGKVTAKARVVTNLQHATHIQRGEVLITFSTDVGWTPYFPLLAGVVTEIGGLISHGAVVAREYGLPCVVGVMGATQIVKSGDTVLLDSSQGTLTILKPIQEEH